MLAGGQCLLVNCIPVAHCIDGVSVGDWLYHMV